jgi:hypothetical protein
MKKLFLLHLCVMFCVIQQLCFSMHTVGAQDSTVRGASRMENAADVPALLFESDLAYEDLLDLLMLNPELVDMLGDLIQQLNDRLQEAQDEPSPELDREALCIVERIVDLIINGLSDLQEEELTLAHDVANDTATRTNQVNIGLVQANVTTEVSVANNSIGQLTYAKPSRPRAAIVLKVFAEVLHGLTSVVIGPKDSHQLSDGVVGIVSGIVDTIAAQKRSGKNSYNKNVVRSSLRRHDDVYRNIFAAIEKGQMAALADYDDEIFEQEN